MRFMIMVKATKESEAGVMPSEQLLTDMGQFNEKLVQAGVMLAGEGLHPTSRGARVRFSGENRTVIGPFAERAVIADLAMASAITGRSDRVGQTVSQSHDGEPRSKFAAVRS